MAVGGIMFDSIVCPDYYNKVAYLSLTSLSQKVDYSFTIKCTGKY